MQNKREHIIEAADDLFYQNGFSHTSFADIANKVKISRGNFYYHFKTKDEILAAVIDRRLAKTQGMLLTWEDEQEFPIHRIKCFIKILINNQVKIKQFGCPVGTLVSEMAKLQHPLASQANKVFMLFQSWLSKQFEQLGFASRATFLARHLLARSQGIATLYNALQEEVYLNEEVELLNTWLDNQVSRLKS